MFKGKIYLLLVLGLFSSFAMAADFVELKEGRPYLLAENEDYFSVTSVNMGRLDYDDRLIVGPTEKSNVEISHVRHSKIDDDTYLIWNFVPVGIGYSFPKSWKEQLSAEWKLNYEPSEFLKVIPNFTGKKKFFWSSLLGNEFVISYGYHYNENPKPSFWDLTMKYSVFLAPLENWYFGAFLQPQKFIKGLYSLPGEKKPYQFESIYSSGLWTEFEFKKNLVIQVQGAVNFFEEYVNKYFAKYSVASSLGFYF